MSNASNDQRDRELVGTTCVGCRYPLRGATEGTCSECGLPIGVTHAAKVEATLAPLQFAKIGWAFVFAWAIAASLRVVHSMLFWSTALVGTDYYTSSLVESRWFGSIVGGTSAVARLCLPAGLLLLALGSVRGLGLERRTSRVVMAMVALVLLHELGVTSLLVRWIAMYAGEAAERAGEAVRYGVSMGLLLWFRGRFATLIGLRLSPFLREAPFVATLVVMVCIFLERGEHLEGGNIFTTVGLWALVIISLLLPIELIRSIKAGSAPFRLHHWRHVHEVLEANSRAPA